IGHRKASIKRDLYRFGLGAPFDPLLDHGWAVRRFAAVSAVPKHGALKRTFSWRRNGPASDLSRDKVRRLFSSSSLDWPRKTSACLIDNGALDGDGHVLFQMKGIPPPPRNPGCGRLALPCKEPDLQAR